MTILQLGKSFLLSAIAVVMLLGCSTSTRLLPKSEILLVTELRYQEASNDPKLRQYAEPELNKADATLKSAAEAETAEEMTHLVYVGNNQINTAIEVAKMNAAIARIQEIKAIRRPKRN